MAQTVKNLPAMQETLVRSLGQENPLEMGMATYSGIPAWEIPWTEEPGGPQSMGSQKSQTHLSNQTQQISSILHGTHFAKKKLFVVNLNSNLTRYLESLFARSGNSP